MRLLDHIHAFDAAVYRSRRGWWDSRWWGNRWRQETTGDQTSAKSEGNQTQTPDDEMGFELFL